MRRAYLRQYASDTTLNRGSLSAGTARGHPSRSATIESSKLSFKGLAGRLPGALRGLLPGACSHIPHRIDSGRAGRPLQVNGSAVVLELGSAKRMDPPCRFLEPGWGVAKAAICRMLLSEMDEHVSLYVTPVNIDPDNPAVPISLSEVLRRLHREEDWQVRDLGLRGRHVRAGGSEHRKPRISAAGLRRRHRARGDVVHGPRPASFGNARVGL